MTDVLLLLLLTGILMAIANFSRQIETEHRELCQLIDALAEMIGEAIDKSERN